ncbi:MAG: hypothetical protein JNL56_13645 [Alphaproteobacteria bacterium]|nr:hypothetical protein [Alphaproteobacteria bacterium]
MRLPTALTLASASLLPLSAAALANAPPPPPGMEAPAPQWEIEDSPVLALRYGTDGDVRIACEEGQKTLRVSIVPDWERGYGKDDGTVFDGPYDKATVTFGDKSFPAVLDPKPADDGTGTTYVLPADADTVTAIMLGTNAKIVLDADAQVREGTPDTSGAFDMFATTCAQINGLR